MATFSVIHGLRDQAVVQHGVMHGTPATRHMHALAL